MTFTTPNPSRVWGIDISGRWDGNVDFSVTRAAGASFVIIKCIDGTVSTRLWKENRNRALEAGLIVGEYAWLYRDRDVPWIEQARATWNLIKNEPKQIPVCVDFEWTKFLGIASDPTYADLDKWVTAFTGLSGYKPGFYSAAGFMNPLGAMPLSLQRKFAYVWVASYGGAYPSMPKGITEWQFWQFAPTGEAEKIAPNDAGKKETDLNYWAGDLKSLQEFAGVTSQPPIEPPTTGETMYKVRSDFYAMTLRPEHNTGAVGSESVPAGTTMDADAIWTATADLWKLINGVNVKVNAVGDKWAHVVRVGAVVKDAWVAIIHKGITYCNSVVEVVEPPTEPTLPSYVTLHYADGRALRYVPE